MKDYFKDQPLKTFFFFSRDKNFMDIAIQNDLYLLNETDFFNKKESFPIHIALGSTGDVYDFLQLKNSNNFYVLTKLEEIKIKDLFKSFVRNPLLQPIDLNLFSSSKCLVLCDDILIIQELQKHFKGTLIIVTTSNIIMPNITTYNWTYNLLQELDKTNHFDLIFDLLIVGDNLQKHKQLFFELSKLLNHPRVLISLSRMSIFLYQSIANYAKELWFYKNAQKNSSRLIILRINEYLTENFSFLYENNNLNYSITDRANILDAEGLVNSLLYIPTFLSSIEISNAITLSLAGAQHIDCETLYNGLNMIGQILKKTELVELPPKNEIINFHKFFRSHHPVKIPHQIDHIFDSNKSLNDLANILFE